jgi:hypothetical protein
VGWRLLGDLRWLQVGCGGRGDVCRRPQRLQGRAQLDELDDGCGGKGESSHQAERYSAAASAVRNDAKPRSHASIPRMTHIVRWGPSWAWVKRASTAAMVRVVVTMPRSCGFRRRLGDLGDHLVAQMAL